MKRVFLRWFRTYGVPIEISTDGGSPFQSAEYKNFCRTWDVQRRLSSAYYPQSNGRAEVAVKSAKRILEGNIDSLSGCLDTDAAAKAIMTHRNTPNQETGIAPSVMLFGRPIRDHLPRHDRELRKEWSAIDDVRELALAKRALKTTLSNGKVLAPLNVGDAVQIQNQSGNHPNKWYNTGIVSECLPHRQYHVIVDGSRRVTLRNRRFLKKILPVSPRRSDTETGDRFLDNMDIFQSSVEPVKDSAMDTLENVLQDDELAADIPAEENELLMSTETRRSKRVPVQHVPLQAKLSGESHTKHMGTFFVVPRGRGMISILVYSSITFCLLFIGRSLPY